MSFSFVKNNPENIKHTAIIIHFNGKFEGNLAMTIRLLLGFEDPIRIDENQTQK
jgi:hypothetical protein